MTEELYREIILDHYKNPRNFGLIENMDIDYFDENPLCGDEIRITAKVVDKKISEMKFNSKGCAISQATASILTDELIGKSIEEIKQLDLNYITHLLNIQLSVSRVKCAMLALIALKKGIINFEGKNDKITN